MNTYNGSLTTNLILNLKEKKAEYGNSENPYLNAFKPLVFFKVFYEKVEFIKANKRRPAFIMKELEKCDFTPTQRSFLYKWLAKYFYTSKKRKDEKRQHDYFNDTHLSICHLELQKADSAIVLPKKKEKYFSEVEKKLNRLLKELNQLPDEPSRIKYLKRESIQYVLDNPSIDEKSDTYLSKIRQQIKNRDSLLRLENPVDTDQEQVRNNRELTVLQATFFFNSLFIELGVNCANTEKAKVISSVTGYTSEKIRQNLSNLNKKAYSNFYSFEKDIKVVCDLLKKLNLNSIIEKLENEVEKLAEETKEN